MTTDNGNNAGDPPAADAQQSKWKERFKSKRFRKIALGVSATAVLATGAFVEYKTSFLQSKYFHHAAEGTTLNDSSCKVIPPAAGPYDEQLGYAHIGQFRDRLKENGYDITCGTWVDRHAFGMRLFPIYNEKSQAGLTITGAGDQTLYQARFPRDAFASFDSVPPLLVNSLLFVENREMMKDHPGSWNPAIEWDRFGAAVGTQMLKKVGVKHDRGAGGSTLATQIEKFRHSPDGITGSASEKLRQMLTASVRSYVDEPNTYDSRRNIVLDYLNSMPLSSYPGFGAVNGYADGMAMWFGTDFRTASQVLSQKEADLNDDQLKEYAQVYRQSLSLVMSVKKPSAYLQKDRAELEDRIDKFLPLMADNHVISPRLKDAVLAQRTAYADPNRPNKVANPLLPKSVQGMEVDLMRTLNVRGLYDLTRLDLTARTTINRDSDSTVTAHLRALADPEKAKADGMIGFQLLPANLTDKVVYTFTLYEKLPDGQNVVRVQADNFNGPLNLNEGVKLELGSTAKLRTLISYLEAVSALHDKYQGQDAASLTTVEAKVNTSDHITRWALEYLADPASDKSLNAMLEASLNRTYSGNPGELFYTGGGSKRYENFEHSENYQNYTVKEAFHKSVNLSFIRIMRDVMYYNMTEHMHVDPAIFTDEANPQRIAYLQQFSDMEGRGFQWKFWGEQKDKSPDQLLQMMADKTRHSPVQLAVVYRSLFPDKPEADMEAFIRKNCKDCGDKTDFQALYDKYAHDAFNLNDRGYITSIHPLALWMAENRIKHPEMTWEQTADASKDLRQEVYKWLFKDGKEHGQNLRIQTMLEKEAFTYIHDDWKKLGYPFATLVPSYSTAIGVSGDTPAALADLAGIIQNDGVRKHAIKFTELDLAKGTPYETIAKTKDSPGARVLPEEIAKLVRREMNGVVEEGTAMRIKNAVTLSNGQKLDVGGKTGTGDNRVQTFSAHGHVTSSEAKSRTGTFVFAIGDRLYGVFTGYVFGPEAGDFKFTSAVAVQGVKALLPDIQPVIDQAYGVTPEMAKAYADQKAAAEAAKKKPKPAVAVATKPQPG
jgi:membrane peptidoglycan carboxypeptidase